MVGSNSCHSSFVVVIRLSWRPCDYYTLAKPVNVFSISSETRKWEEVAVKGQQPEPRSYHSLTTIGSRVVVFGGRGLKNQHFNDFHIFDTGE